MKSKALKTLKGFFPTPSFFYFIPRQYFCDNSAPAAPGDRTERRERVEVPFD